MNRPEGLLLDLFGTLVEDVEFDPVAGNARLLELATDRRGQTAESIQAAAEELEDRLRPLRYSTLELSVPQFQRLLYDGLGIAFQVKPEALELEFWRAAVRCRPEPGVAEALDFLQGQRLSLGVVSNSAFSAAVLAQELRRHGLLPYLAFVVSSADYGIRKPHRLLFEVALARLRVAPTQVWFVGDSLSADITGAQQLGLGAVWYNRCGAPPDNVQPDAETASWPELAALVERHRR
jgi:putative hydrolase of the HAD superfamily